MLVLERADEPGAGASHAAAGMLAPVTETDFGEEPQLRVNLTARERWPGFAAELEERSGLPTGYRESGALVVAADRDDAEALRRLHELQRSLDLDADWLTPSHARRLEPGLSPRIAGAILAHGDGQADPRATTRALAAVVDELELGVEVEAIEHERGRVTGVRTVGRGRRVRRGRGRGGGVEPGAGAGGRRTAGATRQGPDPGAARARRRWRSRSPASSAPRAATSLRAGTARWCSAPRWRSRASTPPLRRTASTACSRPPGRCCPRSPSWSWCAPLAGLRPGTPDNAAVVGPGELEGLIWATGHWRNGVLLAPLTGELVADLLAGGSLAG